MATSTILDPIVVNSANGASILIEALEAAEQKPYQSPSEKRYVPLTDPDAIRTATAKALAKATGR